MKPLLLIFVLLISAFGCRYQEDVIRQGGSLSFVRAFTQAELEETTLTPGLLDSDYFDVILETIVVPIGTGLAYGESRFDTLVDYKLYFQLTKSGDPDFLKARKSLYKYYKTIDPDSFVTTNEKLAFYINAYNFFTLETVLLNYNDGKLRSISDIGGEGSFSAFTKIFHEISGKSISLDQIENEVVRPLVNFADARIHFALICASNGCPILQKKSYRSLIIEDQLDFATKKGLLLDRIANFKGNSLLLGQIFNWFSDDFTNDEGSVTAFLQKYLPKEAPLIPGNFDYIEYDWSLNASH
ncbi:MAG: DUF547 domain-containing protein [Bacteriovoracaceae bacterium]|nr:DUF547 domain-containing protein [Bacteriovoracaceae bacterium]